jgi:hypothetical protein
LILSQPAASKETAQLSRSADTNRWLPGDEWARGAGMNYSPSIQKESRHELHETKERRNENYTRIALACHL